MVNVIGLGYIGLPTALMLAAHGVPVVGTDYNPEVVARLNRGELTFREEGLAELFQAAVGRGIRFSSSYETTDVYIISVPTPYNEESKQVDPCYVVAAVKEVLRVCPEEAVVIIESTVSPGTIDRYVRPLIPADKKLHLAHAPERIIPGNMIYELKHNSRTIGADDVETAERIKGIYSSFCLGDIVLTDIRTAEMTKVIENTYRAVNIAFANELLMLCRKENMDVNEIIRICNMHPRVNILSPGPGVGGHCIPVDPWFLVGDFPKDTPLIHQALKINEGMPQYVYGRILRLMEENGISGFDRVGLYGLTYKEDVDDLRESPTLQLLRILHAKGAYPRVFDPMVKDGIVKNQCATEESFLEGLDLVVVMVGHSALKLLQPRLKDKIVFDTRRVLSGENIVYL